MIQISDTVKKEVNAWLVNNALQAPTTGIDKLEDLGLDSLDLVECHLDMENNLKVRLPDHSMDKVVTVADLMEKVQEAVNYEAFLQVGPSLNSEQPGKATHPELQKWINSNMPSPFKKIEYLRQEIFKMQNVVFRSDLAAALKKAELALKEASTLLENEQQN